MSNKVALIILDGWGIGDHTPADAIFQAQTPFMDYLLSKYPTCQLEACGESVGLPQGQMGNSEVGHLNLGAGRIVYQELTRINQSISDGSFFQNATLLAALDYAKTNHKSVHLVGLVSHGGVHSSFLHLVALIQLCKDFTMEHVFVHAITDGRDCNPKTALNDIAQLQTHLNERIQLASIIGRYYAMDRDNRWERISLAYQLLVNGVGNEITDPLVAINAQYSKGITDEFLPPFLIQKAGVIQPGDVVISFNFRTDRPRQLVQALTQKAYPEFQMIPLTLYMVTMTNYDDSFSDVKIVFEKDNLHHTLGEVLSNAGRRQVRIAETEKYPHVTYFFNGGREIPFKGEDRILVASPKVSTYDLQPEMSAEAVTEELIKYVNNQIPNFICLNYANPDMVGHTGVFPAIVRAIETIDEQLRIIVEFLLQKDYVMLILADHGNAELAFNKDGSPNTAHTLNPVPCILAGCMQDIPLRNGILADVAPTILSLMGVDLPIEMTGCSLLLVER